VSQTKSEKELGIVPSPRHPGNPEEIKAVMRALREKAEKAMSDNLDNSMVAPEQHPLFIEHTRILQALKSVQTLLEQSDVYAENEKNASSADCARQTLFLIHNFNKSALKILKDVLEE